MRFITALCVLFSIAATTVAAGIYRNEAEFKATLESGWYQDGFDEFTYGSFVDYQLDRGPVNGYSYFMNAFGETEEGFGPTLLYSGDGNMSTNSAWDWMMVTFTENLPNAVGGRFFPGDIDGNFSGGVIEMALNDGTIYTLEFPWGDGGGPNDPVLDPFVGFASDVPIYSMIVYMRESEAPTAWPTIDDLIMGRTTTAIPEPGTLALLGIGAALTSLRRRRSA